MSTNEVTHKMKGKKIIITHGIYIDRIQIFPQSSIYRTNYILYFTTEKKNLRGQIVGFWFSGSIF